MEAEAREQRKIARLRRAANFHQTKPSNYLRIMPASRPVDAETA